MSKFKTIAIFSYPAEAMIIKGKLESEQIYVQLRDEFTVATEPFASNAIGGVKMEVHKEDFLRAMGILEQNNPELLKYRLDYIACPNCKKRNAREIRDVQTAIGLSSFFTAVYYSVIPLKPDFAYQCKSCEQKFNLDE